MKRNKGFNLDGSGGHQSSLRWLDYALGGSPKVFEECGEFDEGLEVENGGFGSLILLLLGLSKEESEGGYGHYNN